MGFMSLAKIPCILVATVGLHITATPPQPPPSSDEKKSKYVMEGILGQRSGPFLLKSLCWAGAIAESAVILGNHTHQSEMSKAILSTLAREGTAGRVQITPLFVTGALLVGLGGFIRYRCYHELGWLFTFEMSIRKDHHLITTGPYAIVRHPSYTGVLLTLVGMACWHACPGSWLRECGPLQTVLGRTATGLYFAIAAVITAGLIFRMPKEDEALFETFGKEWAEWQKKVPCRLVPGIY